MAEARKIGMRRSSLESSATEWLAWLSKVDRLAIVDVHLDGPEAAADLLGFAVEPARRRGIELIVGADHTLEELDEAAFFEPDFGYAYSLERLRWRLRVQQPADSRPTKLPDTDFQPDPTQAQAVGAGAGVVQVIAPAGSGKTTVLVERVRELRRRGVSAQKVACVTFNRAAANELKERLAGAGVGDVAALTFHGLGYRVLAEARELPPKPQVGAPTLGQWRMLAMGAKKEVGEDGVWLDPARAKGALSNIKLGLLMTAEQYADSLSDASDGEARTMAALYRAHDTLQRERRQVDFDDLILKAVMLLREDAQARATWQARFHHLLVDEYQDIEPAQELLIRLIAAPHDQLFCVGDEDQTLYAFRRASVERIICLDGLYPGLQRVALGVNYRCPPSIVAASRALIAVNRVRFPKRIEPDPGRQQQGVIDLNPVAKASEAANRVAALLATQTRGAVAVLARTTNALRPVALACADQGVPIDGPDRLFEPVGARRALEDHLRLAVAPQQADARLVQRVCQAPGRGLKGAAHAVAARLQCGRVIRERVSRRRGSQARRRQAARAGRAVHTTRRVQRRSGGDRAAARPGRAGRLVRRRRSHGRAGPVRVRGARPGRARRCQAHATRIPRGSGAPGKEVEGQPRQGERDRAVHDSRSKGPAMAARDCRSPATRALFPTPARWRSVRRKQRVARASRPSAALAYVAFTRAQERLELHYDKGRPSRFLREAGLIAGPAGAGRAARKAPPVPQPAGSRGSSAKPGLSRLLGRKG